MKKRSQGCMEYVVLAVLICAAVAVAIWLFGSQIMAMFGTAGSAACGDHEAAASRMSELQSARDMQRADIEAETHYNDQKWTGASEVRTSELDGPVNPESEGRHSVR